MRTMLLLIGGISLGCAGGFSTPEGREGGSCSDDADNDGDGAFDCDDDGCIGAAICDVPDDDSEADDDIPACREEMVASGRAEGEVPENLIGDDQFGAEVELWNSCDRGVLVMVGALWNDGTLLRAEDMDAYWDDYGPDGLMVLTFLGEGAEHGVAADQDDVTSFAEDYDLQHSVITDPAFEWAYKFGATLELPLFIGLEPGGRIAWIDNRPSDDDIEALAVE